MKVSSILLIAVGVPVMVSCRIMPIQMIRVSQSETFVQTFEFAKGKENQGKALDILEKQIGERNLDVLKNNYDRKDNTASLVNGLFEARGNINVNLSIAPKDHTTFFVDGNGRYFIVNKLKGHILYTSDFNLVPKHYDLRLLTVNREIVIEFNQQLINHFILPIKKGDSFGEENWNFEYNRNIAIHVRIN